MSDGSTEKIRERLRHYALLNAVKFGGKANPKAVAGKLFSEDPSLRSDAVELLRLAEEVVSEINSMPPDAQKSLADTMGLTTTREKVKQVERKLPPLPNADRYSEIHVRFAPNPDSVIHLGNTRAAILSDEYAKMYRGKFTLRFEDTSPSIKPPMPEAYEIIKDDLKWLEISWDDEFVQSERLPIYYEYAENVIRSGGAYICTCPAEDFRRYAQEMRPCPCRDLPVQEQMLRWEGMLNGTIKMGGAVMRIKTDLNHPNPAIRDWPAMRIDTKPHPRQGRKFRVWPLYNFASAVDDHLMGITHILRGKEHEANMHRQLYLYKHLGWTYPEAIQYGRLKIEGAVLSKSKIRLGIEQGLYKDWSDPRLGTIAALRRRGFLPETIRRLILEVGVKPSEALISWENLESMNRKLLDPLTKRFVFLADPVPLEIAGIDREYVAKVLLHPDHPEWGGRSYVVGPKSSRMLIQSRDTIGSNQVVRLMNLFNIRAESEGRGVLVSEGVAEARAAGASIIQWLPDGVGANMQITMPDASVISGLVDPGILEESLPGIFQFYRFGFARVYHECGGLMGYFAHQ